MGLATTPDGTLFSRFSRVARSVDGASGYADETILGGFVDRGGETLQARREYALPGQRSRSGSTPLDEAYPIFAISEAGVIYYSGAAVYDIAAVDLDGDQIWRLSAEVEAPSVTEEDIQRAIRARRPGFEIARDSVDWPKTFPTLLILRVDGHGHLYVYRWVRRDPDALTFPVDVFSPLGEHLFSGTIDRKQWLLGRGDLVYGFAESPSAGGEVAVAYRIREPFAP